MRTIVFPGHTDLEQYKKTLIKLKKKGFTVQSIEKIEKENVPKGWYVPKYKVTFISCVGGQDSKAQDCKP